MSFNLIYHTMNAAQTPEQWEKGIARVRAANHGRLPLFWYDVVKRLGITERPATRWGG